MVSWLTGFITALNFCSAATSQPSGISYLDFKQKLSHHCHKQNLSADYSVSSPAIKGSANMHLDFVCPNKILLDWPDPGSYRYVTNSNETWLFFPSPLYGKIVSAERYTDPGQIWVTPFLDLFKPKPLVTSELVATAKTMDRKFKFNFSQTGALDNFEITAKEKESFQKLNLIYANDTSSTTMPKKFLIELSTGISYTMNLLGVKEVPLFAPRHFNPDTLSMPRVKVFGPPAITPARR